MEELIKTIIKSGLKTTTEETVKEMCQERLDTIIDEDIILENLYCAVQNKLETLPDDFLVENFTKAIKDKMNIKDYLYSIDISEIIKEAIVLKLQEMDIEVLVKLLNQQEIKNN